MKIAANAGPLARALALAASLDASKRAFAALEAVTIASDDGEVTLTRNVLDRQISLTVPATIERSGALALPIASLAALVDGFSPTADVVIEADGPAAQIRSGRSRYKLPVVPPDSMPAPLALTAGVGAVAVSRADALALFAAGFAAAPTSDPRSYLWGCMSPAVLTVWLASAQTAISSFTVSCPAFPAGAGASPSPRQRSRLSASCSPIKASSATSCATRRR
jgi:DNA polymerase-3 subunit beta